MLRLSKAVRKFCVLQQPTSVVRRLLKSLFDIPHPLVNTVYAYGIKLVGYVKQTRWEAASLLAFAYIYRVRKHHAKLTETNLDPNFCLAILKADSSLHVKGLSGSEASIQVYLN